MKAAVLREYGKPFTIEEIQIAKPKNDEVKVKIEAIGLCHTDIAVMHGGFPAPPPVVLGHEGVGVIEEVGEWVTDLKPGDKVVITALVFDGTCPACRSGLYGACVKNGYFMFGGTMRDDTTRLSKGNEVIHSFFCQSSFAEYAVTPRDFVVKVPDDIELEKVVALCCGGSTGIGAVMNKGKVWPGASVAVYGCGVVGMGAIMAAKISGASRIIAIDIMENKLKMAKEFGATDVINAKEVNPVDAVREITGGGTNFAIECIGRIDTISQSLDMTLAGGITVDVGVAPFGAKIPIDAVQLAGEKTLMGSIIGTIKPQIDIPRFIGFYKEGRLPIDKLTQAVFPLEKINDAIKAAEEGKFLKIVIKV